MKASFVDSVQLSQRYRETPHVIRNAIMHEKPHKFPKTLLYALYYAVLKFLFVSTLTSKNLIKTQHNMLCFYILYSVSQKTCHFSLRHNFGICCFLSAINRDVSSILPGFRDSELQSPEPTTHLNLTPSDQEDSLRISSSNLPS